MSTEDEQPFIQLSPTILVDPRTEVVRAERGEHTTKLTLTDGSIHVVFDEKGLLWDALTRMSVQP